MQPTRPFTGPALCALPAREVVALLRKGEVSPAEALDAALTRIAQTSPAINATVTPCPDRARAELARLPGREAQNGAHPGWLAGLPIGIKDLTPVAGVRTTWGSPAYADFVPERSDPMVQRLESRGAIVVGKTNTPEFGAGGNTTNPVFGPTRNPWNTGLNAGGSSGGAAASLKAGEVWLSHGSDLAGSLRTPAAYCGVIGLRPSPGRAGGGPELLGFSTEGVQGPMARDIGDTALFLDAMAGFDPVWPLSIEAPATPFQTAVAQAPDRVRIAYSPDLNGFAPVDPRLRAVIDDAMARLVRSGSVVNDETPALDGLERCYRTLRAMHWAALPGRQPDRVQALMKPSLRANIAAGRALTADDIFDAQRDRTRIYHALRTTLSHHDVLALPVMGVPAGPVTEEYPTEILGQRIDDYLDWLRFSFLAVVAGLPALSMPCGFLDGLPVGLQLIGPPRGEARLLAAARSIERALDLPAGPIDPA